MYEGTTFNYNRKCFFGGRTVHGINVKDIVNPVGEPRMGLPLRGYVVAPDQPAMDGQFIITSKVVQKMESLCTDGHIEYIVRTESGSLYGGRY